MGNYVNSNLLPNESVVLNGVLHWFIFAKPFLYFFIAYGVFSTAISGLPSSPEKLGILVGSGIIFFILLFLPMLLSAFIQRISTELSVTNRRVIAKKGFISRDTIELRHEKVESMGVHQSVLGRILGFGTLTINGTGGVATPIKNVADPMRFRRVALEEVEKVSTKTVEASLTT